MKKILSILSILCFGATVAMAQSNEDMAKQWRDQFQKRDGSQIHLLKHYPMGEASSTPASKDAQGLRLPENVWFPGEWEEVQAIVVTVSYNYFPANHITQNWTADPMLTGYADYYQYTPSGWQERGGGSYVYRIDTTSAHGKVHFYLIDAIQQGGAEAWVRIEAPEDSNIIIRTLNRMNLRSDNIRFIIGPGNSFWYRDCGPICFYYGAQDSVGMVDFEYYPGRALDDSLPSLIEAQMGIPNYITTIEWEGGNCLVDGAGMVISSDAIYSGNGDRYGQYTWNGSDPNTIRTINKSPLTHQQVKDSLAHILGPRATYIVPAFRYDGGTGHIDLYADMWDENEFIFSIFPENYRNWIDYTTANNNINTFTNSPSMFGANYKMTSIPFPCTDNGGNFSSQTVYNNQYTRTYSNHTFINNVIAQPCFSAVVNGEPSAEWDRTRINELKAAYPGYTIYPIDVRSFDGSGGAIHCITKQIPAENPIRILHHSVTRHDGLQEGKNKSIEAIITNRSGIDHASCFWRAGDGDWHEVVLGWSDSNNVWGGLIDFGQAGLQTGDTATIQYYISATSNNGKTITKPMTANQGGFYTFDLRYDANAIGIETAKEELFGQFYPNPCHGKASISIDNNSNYQVNVVDMMGRSLLSQNLQAGSSNTFSINTTTWSRGIYNVVFTTNNGKKVVRRLIVE